MKTRKLALAGAIAALSMVAVPFAGVAAASQDAGHAAHRSAEVRHGDPRSRDHVSSLENRSSRDRGASRDRTPSPDRGSSIPDR